MEEDQVLSDTPHPPLEPGLPKGEVKTQGEEEEKEGEEEEEEEDDAEVFTAWMSRYRAGEADPMKKEVAGGEAQSHTVPLALHNPMRRRSSLPCSVALSATQFHFLHVAAQPPVTAKVLLQRTSSRGLLLSATTPPPAASSPTSSPTSGTERRPSIISTIPETPQGQKTHFRRRNIMSMSDADSMCLICHKDFSKRDGGILELQCSHTFHKQCMDQWLWSHQSCPTCQIHLSTTKSACLTSPGISFP